MSLKVVLRSFDGLVGGATTFDVYLEAGTRAATSGGVFTTVDVAGEVVKRLVFECQHNPQYACDVAVDPDSWKYVGLFPDPSGGPHWARTMPTETLARWYLQWLLGRSILILNKWVAYRPFCLGPSGTMGSLSPLLATRVVQLLRMPRR